MAARSTSRFKQKPAVPFGDFMMPILGVIALGIVVVGIRILWSPAAPKPTVIAQPRIAPKMSQTVSAGRTVEPENRGETETDGVVSKIETISDVQIAQPVQKRSDRKGAETAGEQERKQARVEQASSHAASSRSAPRTDTPKTESRRADTSREPAEKKSVVRGGSLDKSTFVVQCGSYTTRAGANSVVASLKKDGYNSIVRKAEVNGKTYYRVIVAGGTSRPQADEVARSIKETGLPTFVRPKDND